MRGEKQCSNRIAVITVEQILFGFEPMMVFSDVLPRELTTFETCKIKPKELQRQHV